MKEEDENEAVEGEEQEEDNSCTVQLACVLYWTCTSVTCI